MQITYDLNGKLSGIVKDDGTIVPCDLGNTDWRTYIAENGIPPATGIPTNKPSRIPEDYKGPMFTTIKGYSQAQQIQILDQVVCWILVNNPQLAAQINANLGLNPPLPFDKPNP